jgi:hypothetical protein
MEEGILSFDPANANVLMLPFLREVVACNKIFG